MNAERSFWLKCLLVSGLFMTALAEDKAVQKNPAGSPKSRTESSSVEKKASPPVDFPIIGYLEKRGLTITLKAGPKGPVYSAKTTEGKTLFENLSAEQLRSKAPELHEFIKTAVGKDSAKAGVVVDASLRSRGMGLR